MSIKFKLHFSTFILCFILFVATNIQSEAYFKHDRLQFKSNNAWVPTLNGTASAIQFSGSVLTLKDDTIIDSENKNVLHYVSPFIGAIMAFSVSNTANIPTSWLICDGREVKKETYPLLYNAIRDLWGTPVDPANFKLPDLRNFFLRGADDFGSGAASRDSAQRFQKVDFTTSITRTNQTGTYQPSNISSHSHTLSIAQSTNASTATHSHSITNLIQNQLVFSDANDGETQNYFGNDIDTSNTIGATIVGPVGDHTHTMTFTENSSYAGNAATSGLPKRIFLIYCIKYEPI